MSDSKPPRVVLDARVVTGTGGGPDKTILNSPRFLATHGYRNVCAYLHPPGDPGFDVLREKANQLGAPLVELPDRGPLDWRVLIELLRVCRRERVAIYHGHDYKSNLLGLLLKRFWPMRLVTTVHGWVKHTRRTPLYYRIDRFCLPRYEKVIGVSPDLVDECRRVGVPRKRLVLLENGIDVAAYQRIRSVGEAKQELGFDPARPLIGAVGRLSPEKGFDLLIDAVARLRRSESGIQLVIVGEGGEKARLQAMIDQGGLAPDVRLVGFVADPRGVYQALDLFALSSLREGLPNVLLEAMAMGVPCVASRIAGVPRLIENNVSGRLIEPGNVDALASALSDLLHDVDCRERFARAGRELIERQYGFSRRIARLARMYDELLNRDGIDSCVAS